MQARFYVQRFKDLTAGVNALQRVSLAYATVSRTVLGYKTHEQDVTGVAQVGKWIFGGKLPYGNLTVQKGSYKATGPGFAFETSEDLWTNAHLLKALRHLFISTETWPHEDMEGLVGGVYDGTISPAWLKVSPGKIAYSGGGRVVIEKRQEAWLVGFCPMGPTGVPLCAEAPWVQDEMVWTPAGLPWEEDV